MIPFKTLILASDTIANLSAAEELRMSHAQAFGAALSFGTDKTSYKIKRHIRELTRRAHPEVPTTPQG